MMPKASKMEAPEPPKMEPERRLGITPCENCAYVCVPTHYLRYKTHVRKVPEDHFSAIYTSWAPQKTASVGMLAKTPPKISLDRLFHQTVANSFPNGSPLGPNIVPKSIKKQPLPPRRASWGRPGAPSQQNRAPGHQFRHQNLRFLYIH